MTPVLVDMYDARHSIPSLDEQQSTSDCTGGRRTISTKNEQHDIGDDVAALIEVTNTGANRAQEFRTEHSAHKSSSGHTTQSGGGTSSDMKHTPGGYSLSTHKVDAGLDDEYHHP